MSDLDMTYLKCWNDLNDVINKKIEKAVLAEREKCARIVEGFAVLSRPVSCMEIAAKIREGK